MSETEPSGEWQRFEGSWSLGTLRDPRPRDPYFPQQRYRMGAKRRLKAIGFRGNTTTNRSKSNRAPPISRGRLQSTAAVNNAFRHFGWTFQTQGINPFDRFKGGGTDWRHYALQHFKACSGPPLSAG